MRRGIEGSLLKDPVHRYIALQLDLEESGV